MGSFVFELLALIITFLFGFIYLGVIYNYYRKVRFHTATNTRLAIDKNSMSSSNLNEFTEKYNQAPGPFPLPILGNLHLLGRSKSPFIDLTNLTTKFGDIYSLTLGTRRCLVVNNLDLIREVLNKNGKYFGGRTDFIRYNVLFGGDRKNSLALCDWSQLQQKRRNLARRHCSPRNTSSLFARMSDVGHFECQEFMKELNAQIIPGQEFNIKPLIRLACGNMFLQYMATCRFEYTDTDYQKIIEYFDEIFWEINQGYPVDFLPWLAPFYKNHFKKISHWSTTIRKFIEERVIKDREQRSFDDDELDLDFTDALFRSVKEHDNVTRDTIIYMLEDFVGGHSAVANLAMLSLTYVAKHPHVAVNIQNEVDEFIRTKGKGEQQYITLIDMDVMPYTMATIYEVLRFSSSPIVPHVATEDAVIAGYGVTEGTIVFINNYKLNTSEEYWNKPDEFDPEKFLEDAPVIPLKRRNSEAYDSGVEIETTAKTTTTTTATTTPKFTSKWKTIQAVGAAAAAAAATVERRKILKKNIPHFLPFSIGKRTCIGQSLVRGFGFVMLANVLKRYDVSCNDASTINIYPATTALPAKTHSLIFKTRLHVAS